MQWEYKVVIVINGLVKVINRQDVVEKTVLHELLNELGLEGWEVVGYTDAQQRNVYSAILKRPLQAEETEAL